MDRRSNLGTLAAIVALLAVLGCIALLNFADRSRVDKGKSITSFLEVPFFTSSAEASVASRAADAFPADVAGISAYVKVEQTIEIKKITPIFSKIEDLGDNYTIGIVPIPNFGGAIGVHVYVDTDGWFVAYLEAGEAAAKIMQWGDTDPKKPEIGAVKSTTLEDALYKLADAADVRIASQDIRYYHFKYPDANGMTLFVKTREQSGTSVIQIEIPVTYALYEASYYHYEYIGGSLLKLDEAEISKSLPSAEGGFRRAFGSYGGAIKTGIPHKMEVIGYGVDPGESIGVATILVYKTG